jgi:hypothetical protein
MKSEKAFKEDFPTLHKEIHALGSRPEYIFDILAGLEAGLKQMTEKNFPDETYINEKRESLVRAAENIAHDVHCVVHRYKEKKLEAKQNGNK